ncbi:hypothetical protein [Rhizobium leguminosarum]|uniref:hypothetical protein n=1 Tax=Rhizobium leguminosarum TaxID=384 RepID=UPI003CFD1351
MGIFFIVALVFAWPTYGLSIIGWLVLVFFKSRNTVAKSVRRKEFVSVLEPMFNGRFADFYRALEVPLLDGFALTEKDAHQCGRHVMNYLAQNPEEAALFVSGLEKWRTKGTSMLSDPVTAAQSEKMYDDKGEIHLTAYRAIKAVMLNNSLKCFDAVNLAKLMENETLLTFQLAGRI